MLKKAATAKAKSDVHIWYCVTPIFEDDAANYFGQYLSPEEALRRDRLRFRADRNAFAIAHDLLRRSLSRYADVLPAEWQFATNEYGKPSIESLDPKARSLSFNLSSTRGCAACAITSCAPIGVDVERVERSRCIQEVADRYFSDSETAWLRNCTEQQRQIRFTQLWVLKEAFLKAIGIGLSGTLNQISFQIDEHSYVSFAAPSASIDPDEWHFALFEPVENVRLAVAVRSVQRPHFIIRRDPVTAARAATVR